VHGRLVVLVSGLVAACGDGDNGETVDAPPAVIDGVMFDAPPPGEPRFDVGSHRGRIEVLELAGGPWTGNALAHANFAPAPTLMRFVFYARVAVRHWQRETMRIGSCRLLELTPAFCTACAGICVEDEVCEPYPEYAQAGDLTFDGLHGGPVVLQPNGYFYASQGAKLPVDAFADDATVTVTATGEDVPAFTVNAGGVPPLVAAFTNDELHVADTADAVVQWTPADPTDPDLRVRLTLNANNAGHGLPYESVIECDTEDVGGLTVPAPLIAAFPTTERWEACAGSDCPLSTLTRYRKGSVDVAGTPVDLAVGSQIHLWVIHP
jgi:hypothetical protein